ncbi:MAG: hypothetical protein CFE21_06775 [Bacteroidetes bacterium B1(2017)]|nr:MAG: hypothetical protein CFE21_06775 [Bacteroidetes bacterium B1(2017)]
MNSTYTRILIALISLFNLSNSWAQRVDSVDVYYYNIHVNLQNITSKQIQGTCKINCTALFNQTRSLVLDLQNLPVSQVLCNNKNTYFSQTDSTLHINLTESFQKGDSINLEVSYAGSPVKDARWGGFFFNGNYAFNMGVGMASNPPNFGRCWFPCIDNFTDRAKYEFHITTDTGFMAVCSGLQDPATINGNGSITWNWHLNQSIPTYIANVAVSKYVLINSSYSGIARNIPISLAVSAADTLKAKASFAKLNDALSCFESKFGPYLFDRVGYVGVPFTSGAMEHACNISFPLYAVDGSTNYETLMAHELSHHWFGNLVTTRTASDMWLNEGWASYCEALFLECVYGKATYEEKMNSELFEVLRWAHVRDKGYKPVSGVPLAQTYGTHVYTKGSLMVHSLRMLINNDTAFFNTVKTYLAANRFKDVSTSDLQAHFEKRFGGMIAAFFNSYIYDKGHTDLQFIRINNNGKQNCEAIFQLMSRHKTNLPELVWAFVSYNLGTQWNEYYAPIYRNNQTGDYSLAISTGNLTITNFKIGINQGTMNGASTQKEWVKGTTPKTFANVLLTITPQINSDSTYFFIQHHFAQPWIGSKQLPVGIRISGERYWNIDGLWNDQFKATAFFNYDGSTPSATNTGYLDNELISGLEDSLVLLFRKDAESPFVVETDLTKQMGPSKIDKTGRFWVNNLKKGDYVFGVYDIRAGIKAEPNEGARKLIVYPNPTDGAINIQLPANHGTGKFSVFTMNAVLIIEHKVSKSDTQMEIQTGNWQKGAYTILFEDEKGKLTQTFIVK